MPLIPPSLRSTPIAAAQPGYYLVQDGQTYLETAHRGVRNLRLRRTVILPYYLAIEDRHRSQLKDLSAHHKRESRGAHTISVDLRKRTSVSACLV
jgi:hypothetical protein